MFPSSSLVCRYFARSGRCFSGSECKFLHTQENPSASQGKAEEPRKNKQNNQQAEQPEKTKANAPVHSDDYRPIDGSSFPSAPPSSVSSSFPSLPFSSVPVHLFPGRLSDVYADFQSFQPVVGFCYGDFLVFRFRLFNNFLHDRLAPDHFAFKTLPATVDNRRYNSLMPLADPSAGDSLDSLDLLHRALDVSGIFSRQFKVFDSLQRSPALIKILSGAAESPVVEENLAEFMKKHTRAAECSSSVQPLSVPQTSVNRFDVSPAAPFDLSGLVAPRRIFSSKEFGPLNENSPADGSATILVSDFQPLALSLADFYLGENAAELTERQFWLICTDLLMIIQQIEENQLFNHVGYAFNLKKILITPGFHLQCSGLGVYSLLRENSPANAPPLAFDWFAKQFRSMITVLASRLLPEAVRKPFSHYCDVSSSSPVLQEFFDSPELSEALKKFLRRQHEETPRNSSDLAEGISQQILGAYNQRRIDGALLEKEFLAHCESNRLFTLLAKLNYLLSHNFQENSANFLNSLTGDAYLLELLRFALFSSQLAPNVPNLDDRFLVDHLNRLDSGSSEKILLMAENSENMLVVRYSDLKRALMNGFEDLKAQQRAARAEVAQAQRLLAESPAQRKFQ